MICVLLVYKNILDPGEKSDFIEPDAFTLVMRLLTAYLFHIETLGDA